MPSWNVDRWFAILSFLVGTGLSYYFYDIAREERDLVFRVDPNRSEIISASRVNNAPIKVLRKDGSPVQNDVHAVQFYVWNAGKRSIRLGDVLTPLELHLSPNASMLDYGVLRMSRPIVAAHLTEGTKPPLRDLGIEFRILEQNDGFVGQVIYEGPKDAILHISGLVEGVPEIRTKPVGHFWDMVVDRWQLIAFILCNLAITGRMVRKFWALNVQGQRKLKLIVTSGFLALVCLSALGLFLDYKQSRSKREADNSRQVPESLRAVDLAPPPMPTGIKLTP